MTIYNYTLQIMEQGDCVYKEEIVEDVKQSRYGWYKQVSGCVQELYFNPMCFTKSSASVAYADRREDADKLLARGMLDRLLVLGNDPQALVSINVLQKYLSE